MTSKDFYEEVIALEPDMTRYARMLLRNKIDHRDLVQDTYLKALINRDKFKPGTNLVAWLFTILKNNYINEYNVEKRRESITNRLPDPLMSELSFNSNVAKPDEILSAKEISGIINTIPSKHAETLKLHVSGYKHSEIATMTGTNEGTVKSRIFRAREYMSKQINL